MTRLTAKERMDRLRAALRADARPGHQQLATRLDECRVRANGRYRCKSPACSLCRWRVGVQQQRVARQWFGHHQNADLAYVSVVLEATSNVANIGDIVARSKEATRKRITACRNASRRWDEVYFRGWHEVDAIAPDQLPLVLSDRRGLLEQIVPWSGGSQRPVWIGTYNGIVYLNGLSSHDIRSEFTRQWKLDGQVFVEPFRSHQTVEENIDRIVSYGNKFGCETHLEEGFIDPWPASWEAEYFSWLQGFQRNPFEFLRFGVYPLFADDHENTLEAKITESVEPMPCSFSTVPMYINTGWV